MAIMFNVFARFVSSTNCSVCNVNWLKQFKMAGMQENFNQVFYRVSEWNNYRIMIICYYLDQAKAGGE